MKRLLPAIMARKTLIRSPQMWGALAIVLFSVTPGIGQVAGNKMLRPKAIKVSRTTVESQPQTVAAPSAPAAMQSVGHRHCCNRPEVFLLRGGAGYWPKVGQFEESLRARGFEPRTIYHWQFRGLADEVARSYHAGELAGPVSIIGYSSGADSACWMSERLNKAGVPVTNLILIESTLGADVPSNVSFCYNIYQSRWADAVPAFRGIAISAHNPNTQLYNVDVRYHPELANLAELNHFTMGVSPEMHNYLGDILAQRVYQQQPAMQVPGDVDESGEGTGKAPAREAARLKVDTLRK